MTILIIAVIAGLLFFAWAIVRVGSRKVQKSEKYQYDSVTLEIPVNRCPYVQWPITAKWDDSCEEYVGWNCIEFDDPRDAKKFFELLKKSANTF